MMKASGNIPALCKARAWDLVLGNPDKMKLFFSLLIASIYFLTIFITMSSLTIEKFLKKDSIYSPNSNFFETSFLRRSPTEMVVNL